MHRSQRDILLSLSFSLRERWLVCQCTRRKGRSIVRSTLNGQRKKERAREEKSDPQNKWLLVTTFEHESVPSTGTRDLEVHLHLYLSLFPFLESLNGAKSGHCNPFTATRHSVHRGNNYLSLSFTLFHSLSLSPSRPFFSSFFLSSIC